MDKKELIEKINFMVKANEMGEHLNMIVKPKVDSEGGVFGFNAGFVSEEFKRDACYDNDVWVLVPYHYIEDRKSDITAIMDEYTDYGLDGDTFDFESEIVCSITESKAVELWEEKQVELAKERVQFIKNAIG